MAKRARTKVECGDEVRVYWEDACGSSRWRGQDNLQLNTIISTGFVVANEANRLTIAASVDRNDGHLGEVLNIPRGMIRQVVIENKRVISPEFWIKSDIETKAAAFARKEFLRTQGVIEK